MLLQKKCFNYEILTNSLLRTDFLFKSTFKGIEIEVKKSVIGYISKNNLGIS